MLGLYIKAIEAILSNGSKKKDLMCVYVGMRGMGIFAQLAWVTSASGTLIGLGVCDRLFKYVFITLTYI